MYQPLDQGSNVPWAQAHLGAGAMASARRAPGGAHVVRSGDRLGGLADRYGLSVPQLAQANHLPPPYTIRVGQVLRVPARGPGAIMVARRERRSTAVASAGAVAALPRSVAAQGHGRGTRPMRAGRSPRWT